MAIDTNKFSDRLYLKPIDNLNYYHFSTLAGVRI